MRRAPVLILVLILAALTLSCGQAKPKTTELSLMFQSVPSELASANEVWFSNMKKVKELAGLAGDADAAKFVKLLRATTDKARSQYLLDLMSGYYPSEFSGEQYLEYWKDAFGYDALVADQEITVQSVLPPRADGAISVRPIFSVMKGNFDKDNIIQKLNGYGYQIRNYESSDYYSLNEDYKADLRSFPQATMSNAFLNRMLVEKQNIIAAPADEIFFPVLDARSNNRRSLDESLAYARTAESLGDILSAALIPQVQLQSKNIDTGWGNLHAFDLAGLGYQVEGQILKLSIVLHYPDKSATGDITELKRRMAEYEVTAGGVKTPRLSELFEIGEPAAVDFETDSVLKVELKYKPETRSSLWYELVEAQDLGFLVSVPNE